VLLGFVIRLPELNTLNGGKKVLGRAGPDRDTVRADRRLG
jgi:hypothetical protein